MKRFGKSLKWKKKNYRRRGIYRTQGIEGSRSTAWSARKRAESIASRSTGGSGEGRIWGGFNLERGGFGEGRIWRGVMGVASPPPPWISKYKVYIYNTTKQSRRKEKQLYYLFICMMFMIIPVYIVSFPKYLPHYHPPPTLYRHINGYAARSQWLHVENEG